MNFRLSPTTTAVGDVGVGLEEVLDRLGGDVLAAGGDDDVLFPVGDDQKAVLVEMTDVAGVEPTALEVPPGLRFLLVIAFHDVRPAGQDLAVRGDPDLDTRDRLARPFRTSGYRKC